MSARVSEPVPHALLLRSPPPAPPHPTHEQVYAILDEYIISGELQETSQLVILDRLRELEKMMV